MAGIWNNTSQYVNTTYKYNDEGIRTKKVVNGVKHTYSLSGSQIVAEEWGSNLCVYLYDADGAPIGMQYRTESMSAGKFYTFWFERNLQGDIIAVYNEDGVKVCTYTYDAWGNVTLTWVNSLATNLYAVYNPFKYRGYYHDTETGFYYLQSRYYDPIVGRFINADTAIGQIGNIHGTNMFVYCFNNPVSMSDPIGNWPKLSTIFTVVAVVAVSVAAVAVTVATCGATAPALAVAGGGIIGGVSAGTAATATGIAAGAMVVASASTLGAIASTVAEKATEKTAKRDNSVYVLKDDAGVVQYVGRTNNVDRRKAVHGANPVRAGLQMEVIASGLNLPEARALEQAGMAYYHTINTANKMNNQINSVSPKYWGTFKELALGVLDYGWNQMTNEILYWTGN